MEDKSIHPLAQIHSNIKFNCLNSKLFSQTWKSKERLVETVQTLTKHKLPHHEFKIKAKQGSKIQIHHRRMKRKSNSKDWVETIAFDPSFQAWLSMESFFFFSKPISSSKLPKSS